MQDETHLAFTHVLIQGQLHLFRYTKQSRHPIGICLMLGVQPRNDADKGLCLLVLFIPVLLISTTAPL
jgi:hypothetical protein